MRKIAVLSMAAASVFSTAQVYSGGGGSVPDATATAAGSFSSSITSVPGLTSVTSITILGFRHTWAGDLRATVTAPDSTVNTLFVRIGRTTANALGSPFGDSSNFGGDGTSSDGTTLSGRDYAFVATGGADLWAHALDTTVGGGIGLTAGTYNATGATSGAATGLFPGSYAGGTWTLTIEDWAGGDTPGLFDGWELRGTPVPEPATMAVLGLGAAALLRRRRK